MDTFKNNKCLSCLICKGKQNGNKNVTKEGTDGGEKRTIITACGHF